MSEPIVLPDLLAGGWRGCEFEPFREGVDICPLFEGPPQIALLRYAPGARVPRHVHTGVETILVLDGAQSDERGTYGLGAWIVNPVGFEHSVWSDSGCVVLIQWSGPVEFMPVAGDCQ